MKKLILTLVISCCMILMFAIPVFATSYTWSVGGNKTKVKYDLESFSEATIKTAIQEACGTTENVYYICRYDPNVPNRGYFDIDIMLDVEIQGIKGNVGYVFDDNHGLYTDYFNTIPHWKRILISDNGTYISKYNNSDGAWERYPSNGSDEYGACTVYTNIPIFNTKEGLDDYFATGNTSDMIGAEPEYDTEVKIPENVHIEKRFLSDEWIPRITLSFSSPCNYSENGYKSEVRYRFSGEFFEDGVFGESKKNRLDFKSDFEKIDYFNTQYQNYVGNTSNSNTLIYNYFENFEGNYKSYNAYQEVESKKNAISFVGTQIKIIEIWVRNINSDNHSSDWVKCIYDIENDKLVETWTDQVVSGTTEVIDGSVDPGNEKPENIKDSYDITGDYSTSNFVNNISNLFGLIGENGLIPMLGRVFSFLPAPIITIMLATFSAVAGVIVLKFVRG